MDESGAHLIRIRRLLCPKTGKTISLLPDFLVPHKQYTAWILATFLHLFAWIGLSLAAAVSVATRREASWQLGHWWSRSVLERRNQIRAYIATLANASSSPTVPAPAKDSPVRQTLRSLLTPLRVGFDTFPPAFVEHSREMHGHCGLALC